MNIFDRIKQNVFGIPLYRRGFYYSYPALFSVPWTQCKFCKASNMIEVSGRDWKCLNCGASGHDPVLTSCKFCGHECGSDSLRCRNCGAIL